MDDPAGPREGRTTTAIRKAGRKPAFSEQDVIDAALAEGIDRFTLSAVADRVGVVTAAIYRLFPSREAIVVACLDSIAATTALPDADADWRSILQLWADECWRICESYPGLSRTVYTYAPAFTRIENTIKEYARALAAHGKTNGQTMFALDFIGDTVFACHLGVESWRAEDTKGNRGFDQVLQSVDADSILRPRESWLERGVVDVKVEFIISGLAHEWPEI